MTIQNTAKAFRLAYQLSKRTPGVRLGRDSKGWHVKVKR